jgi:hypothetical protein
MEDDQEPLLFRLFAGPAKLVKQSIGREIRKVPFRLFGKRITNIRTPYETTQITSSIDSFWSTSPQSGITGRPRAAQYPTDVVDDEEDDTDFEPLSPGQNPESDGDFDD